MTEWLLSRSCITGGRLVLVIAMEIKTSKDTDKREGVSKLPPRFLYYQDAGAFHWDRALRQNQLWDGENHKRNWAEMRWSETSFLCTFLSMAKWKISCYCPVYHRHGNFHVPHAVQTKESSRTHCIITQFVPWKVVFRMVAIRPVVEERRYLQCFEGSPVVMWWYSVGLQWIQKLILRS